MEKFEILIIGGGPAAITMAKNIGSRKKMAIIRPEDHSMIYCAMPYVIEGIIPFEKSLKKDEIVTSTGTTLIRDRVEKVDFKQHAVFTEKGGEYTYEKLIVATGADPFAPPIKGVSLEGVMTFKTEKDLNAILSYVDSGIEKAVVVGAGAIGIELAQALNEAKVETSLIDVAPHILPNMVDSEMIKDAQQALKDSGINLVLGNKVISVKGEEIAEGIVLDNGKEILFKESEGSNLSAGIVVFAIGMKPCVDLFKETDLLIEQDGIVVNEKMETNIKDVYSVGDCVQFKSGISGERISGKLATNAVPMGKILAKNILGEDRIYRGFFNGAATKVGDYYVGSTGFTEASAQERYNVITGYSEFTTAFPVMPFAKKVRMKIVVDMDTLKVLGGQVVSGEPVTDKVDLLTMAIQHNIKVSDLINLSYSAQPYQSFFPANNLIVQASEDILAKLKK